MRVGLRRCRSSASERVEGSADRKRPHRRAQEPRSASRQGCSIPPAGRSRATVKTPVEMTPYGNHKTVSTGTWKSRTEREIPTFPQPILVRLKREKNKSTNNDVDQ